MINHDGMIGQLVGYLCQPNNQLLSGKHTENELEKSQFLTIDD